MWWTSKMGYKGDTDNKALLVDSVSKERMAVGSLLEEA